MLVCVLTAVVLHNVRVFEPLQQADLVFEVSFAGLQVLTGLLVPGDWLINLQHLDASGQLMFARCELTRSSSPGIAVLPYLRGNVVRELCS